MTCLCRYRWQAKV